MVQRPKASAFHYGSVATPEDIAFAHDKCRKAWGFLEQEGSTTSPTQWSNSCSDSSDSLAQLLKTLMVMQQNHLASLTFSYQDLVCTRIDGTVIETVCPCGQYKFLDARPHFTCADERGYVMSGMRGCRSAECNPNGKVRGNLSAEEHGTGLGRPQSPSRPS